MILDENLFENYLIEEEQKEEDSIIKIYLRVTPTIGHIDSKGNLVIPEEEWDGWD